MNVQSFDRAGCISGGSPVFLPANITKVLVFISRSLQSVREPPDWCPSSASPALTLLHLPCCISHGCLTPRQDCDSVEGLLYCPIGSSTGALQCGRAQHWSFDISSTYRDVRAILPASLDPAASWKISAAPCICLHSLSLAQLDAATTHLHGLHCHHFRAFSHTPAFSLSRALQGGYLKTHGCVRWKQQVGNADSAGS